MTEPRDSQLISVFDTTVSDDNLGNQIIMEAVDRELQTLFPEAFFLRLPALDSIGPISADYVARSAHCFFGGTNALSADMGQYSQWGLTADNLQSIRDVVLLGVGWWQYQDAIHPDTAAILQKVLHGERLHAVRDSYSRDQLASIGIDNVLVTACPSMWGLSPEHCARIPTTQGRDALLTFTSYAQDRARDEVMVAATAAAYRDLYVWVQGPEDLAYARELCGERATILAPNLAALDQLLSTHPSLDYVGTRLHAGIRALSHGRRSLIVGVDNRAIEKGKDFGLPVIPREQIAALPGRICGEWSTDIQLPQDAIHRWRAQWAPASAATVAETSPAEPISRQFGFDRGNPIDRFYIERFLDEHRGAIRGRVLEVADDSYTRQFGTDVEHSEVLHADASTPGATLSGDLQDPDTLPEGRFDCILLTQTLQLLYDPKTALRNTLTALRPGGSLLLTVPGISQISRYDMDRWGDYWRFTDRGLERLVRECLPDAEIEVCAHGNVTVAQAFLDGRAREEIEPELLWQDDPDYQLLLTLRVTRPAPVVETTAPAATIPAAPPRPVASQVAEQDDGHPLILLYHRVADDPIDAQRLCVSPEHFDQQLAVLRQERQVVPLQEMLTTPRRGQVAITFDDGYRDVYENGLPILEKHGLLATVFVTSGMVDTDQEFWWDRLQHLLLTGAPLPPELSVSGFGPQSGFGDQVLRTETPEQRVATYDALCAAVRTIAPEEIVAFLEQLEEWAGGRPVVEPRPGVLSLEQLRALDASPQIEIGSHTLRHPSLAAMPVPEQELEVQGCKHRLETWLEHPVTAFAYPFGSVDDFSPATLNIVRRAGFAYAAANVQGELRGTVEGFALPRRLVRNWNGESFSGWLRSADRSALEQATIARRVPELIAAQNQPQLVNAR